MIGAAAMSLVLLGLSGAMIDARLRTWRRVQAEPPSEPGRLRLERGRLRRRLQAAALIGACGALIAVWPIAPREPLWMAAFTFMLLTMTLWMVSLAMVDAWATAHHYRRLRDASLVEQSRLVKRLERQQEAPRVRNG